MWCRTTNLLEIKEEVKYEPPRIPKYYTKRIKFILGDGDEGFYLILKEDALFYYHNIVLQLFSNYN